MEEIKETIVFLTTDMTYYFLPFLNALNGKNKSLHYYQEYHIPTFDEEAVDRCVNYLRKLGKSCIISFNDASSTAAAVLNDRLGYPYPSLLSQVYCMNKLLTRMLVGDFDWYYGFNLDDPMDSVINKVKFYPCILKPTMLVGGKAVFRCNDVESLRSALHTIHADKATSERVKEVHANTIELLQGNAAATQCTHYMIEEFIETKGTNTYQFCMEAFVTKEGNVIPYALAEEFLFKNGMFLGHIIPPVHLGGSLEVCEDYITKIGEKLYQLGFRNQAFNIEFWKFPDGEYRLIEINPRIATPYYDLYEQYSGSCAFEDVSSLIVHGKEPPHTPFSKLRGEWSAKGHEQKSEEYVIAVELSTHAIGKASDIFNFEFLEEMFEAGEPMFLTTPRDIVLTEIDRTREGKNLGHVVLKGSWNDIVRGERDLRKRFYKDLSQCVEGKQYPDYFVEAHC